MLCPSCRRQLERGARWCTSCGAPLGDGPEPLEVVLPEGTRVPVLGEMTIGRAPGATLQLADPATSRLHARILLPRDSWRAWIEDAGSSHGTWVDGERVDGPRSLRHGSRIQIGDVELEVQRRRSPSEPGRTIVVPPGASVALPAAGAPEVGALTRFGMHPRVRSGYALKRVDEGWVLRNLQSGAFLRLSDGDARLFELLDGDRSLPELVRESEALSGANGPARLARLLADLGERGLLAGVEGAAAAPPGRWRALLTPRELSGGWLGRPVEWSYRHGGWLLFTRPGLVAVGALAVAGIGVFAALIALRYGTPFVVARKLGLGALVFLGGRFAVVAVHEWAHGLALASCGRRAPRAGVKVVVALPFAFVDTSEAWFEPRRRRICISAAGPASDLALGAIFSLCCLLLDAGTVRDIFFQLAFGAYLGAFFNLNPFLERDGYHMLVDVMREPGLRRRAREQFARRLSGRGRGSDSRVLARYSAAGLGWSLLAVGFAVLLSLRYEPVLVQLAPSEVVWVLLGGVWAACLVPVLVVVGRPLVERVRA